MLTSLSRRAQTGNPVYAFFVLPVYSNICSMSIKYEFDTISATATPAATGGVGIVRVSGAKALEIAQKISSVKEFTPNFAHHGWIKDNEEPVDEVIILYFKAPKSFTGEDVIEIHAHGGINVVKKILELTLKNGARLAERGEFSKRAFLNGKIDLSKAEAILDIIHAKTQKFASKSAKNLSGRLAEEIFLIRKILFDLLSQIIAGIDFPDDMPEPGYTHLKSELQKAKEKIEKILSCANGSNIMRQGLKVAIAGRPNVGKSSLFNNLLNLERAIVTDIAGTTRDVIQETLDIEGIPVTLIDTAGIREKTSLDKVEKIGIDYTKQTIQEADFVLFLYDSTTGFSDEDSKIFDLLKDKPRLKIAAKSDLTGDRSDTQAIYFSNFDVNNIECLKAELAKNISDKEFEEGEFMTNRRQEECLNRALNSVNTALFAVKEEELQDLISIDVKAALLALDELSGEVITDDILNNIFENFCIGK